MTTPLHKAARYGHIEAIRLLIDVGADVNAKSKRGDTPLHEAARQWHAEAIQLLIDADIHAEDKR